MLTATRPEYWADTPSDAEIRDAEKRHKEAFESSDICELIEAKDEELLHAFRHRNISAIGSILYGRYSALLDRRVEISIHGRVMGSTVAAGETA